MRGQRTAARISRSTAPVEVHSVAWSDAPAKVAELPVLNETLSFIDWGMLFAAARTVRCLETT